VEVLNIGRFCCVYKTGEIKLMGRKFIYQTKCNARNIFYKISLRIANSSRERILTKLVYVRSEVLTALLLTIQVFRDVTPCHWVSPRVSKEQADYFEGHVAWHCCTRRLLFSEKHQTNKQEQDPLRSTCLSERVILTLLWYH
jgi:hypothetical protein